MKFAFLMLIFIASFTNASESDTTKYRKLAREIQKCLHAKSRSCLASLISEKVYFVGTSEFKCKEKMNNKEFADCIFDSKGEQFTLKSVLERCVSDPKTQILPQYKQFNTDNGYICFVESVDGKLKLDQINAGE